MTRARADREAGSAITISRGSQSPLYRQIYERVRHGIARGTYPPGSRLPSARDLASELGIARGTVEDAYGLLVAEGYVERHGQFGSVVARGLVASAGTAGLLEPAHHRRPAPAPAPRSSARLRSPFQLGRPALDAFPVTTWARLVARHARKPPSVDTGSRDNGGNWALKEAIARYLGLSRGVTCSPEQVLITNGYQGAIDLVARTVLRGGDKVWFEEPGYIFAREALQAAGAAIVPVGVDAEGMRVGDAIAAAPRARLAVTTPAHHSPLCVTLSLQRRLQLLQWAEVRQAYIVEDDYDGEFHYGGRPLPALKSLDRDDRVIYAGSFSKTLLPELRLGYVVSPMALLGKLSEAASVRSAAPGGLMQGVVAEFMQEGRFVRHLHRMRRLYAQRREALAAALRETFDGRFAVDSQQGGMQMLLELPATADDVNSAELAADAGLAVAPLSPTYVGRGRQKGLMLGFANVLESKALPLCRKLDRAISAGS